jgi:hypothetical protein
MVDGRPRQLKGLLQLIREMAAKNPAWREERIADELRLKPWICVSPRTVEKHLHRGGPARAPDFQQRWLSFVIHDRDSILSKELDRHLTNLGVRVLRTPVRAVAPAANRATRIKAFVVNRRLRPCP